MFQLGSTDHWSFGSDAFPPLWFCVRVLVHDGLQVEPFDQHPDGDGQFRALGLNAETWRRWVVAVLDQNRIVGEFGLSMSPTEVPSQAELDRVNEAAKVLLRPGSFCPGSNALQRELNDTFVPLFQIAEDWKTRTLFDMPRRHGSSHEYRQLWQSLTSFHDRLPKFEIFLVEYLAPALMTLAPSTAIISPAPNPAGYARQIHDAAAVLATS